MRELWGGGKGGGVIQRDAACNDIFLNFKRNRKVYCDKPLPPQQLVNSNPVGYLKNTDEHFVLTFQ